MEINLPKLRSLFSFQKEWHYQNGQLVKKYKKTLYIGAGIIAALVLILAASIMISILKKDIIIADGEKELKVSTFKATVEEVLEEQGIQIGPDDRLVTDTDMKLADDIKIEIKRAKPVMIKTQQRDILLYTCVDTVEEALKEAGITLGILDRTEPETNALLKDVKDIEVIRVEEQIITETQTIPYENEIRENEELEKGLVKVITEGKEGKKETSIKIVYENGVEADRQIIEEKIVEEPVAGVIEEGVKTTLVSSRGTTRFVKAMEMIATAYDATFESTGKTPDHPQYGITRSGLRVRPGIVAVDPNVIPLGTWLYVEGYGEALAADTGGAIKGNKIDLYFESPEDVAKYGKRKVKVYILDKPRYKF